MPKMAIPIVKTQYFEGNTKDLYVETMRPGRADFYFAEAKCKSRVSRKEVPYRAPKVSRNDPKTTLLTRTPWPRKILEIFPRRACLSDLCLNVQIVCFSFKLQRVCTLRATILLYPCLNVRILHNVKGGCGWDWMRVVVLCSPSQLTPPHPILFLKSKTPHHPTGQ